MYNNDYYCHTKLDMSQLYRPGLNWSDSCNIMSLGGANLEFEDMNAEFNVDFLVSTFPCK